MWTDKIAGRGATIATHPVLAGERVVVVRSDPFGRFVVVRIQRRRGDYRKGDELSLSPDVVLVDAPESTT